MTAGLQLGGNGARAAFNACALLFDLGGTLDADGLGWGERFAALLRAELPQAASEQIVEALAAGERTVLQYPRAAALGLEEMVALHVTAQLEVLGAAASQRRARLIDAFHGETDAALRRRRPLLERLARRIPLGIVSNGCGNTETLLRECGLADLFGSIVDSTCVGAWKPDPAIFAPALARLGLPASHVAMVGDRLDRDVEGAAAAGLAAVWVSGGRPLDPAHPQAPAVRLVVPSVDALDPGIAS